jgi:hypothetical protein
LICFVCAPALGRAVMTDRTANCGTDNSMVASDVACNAAHGSAS